MARWADAVERAAYGGGVVDAETEGDVQRLAPDPNAAGARPSVRLPLGSDPSSPGRAQLESEPMVDMGAKSINDTEIDVRPPAEAEGGAATLVGHGPPRR